MYTSTNPFGSIAFNQIDFLKQIILRRFASGVSRESIRSNIETVINSAVDGVILDTSMLYALIDNLKTPDAKEIAISECIAFKNKLLLEKPMDRYMNWSKSQGYMNRVNDTVDMVFNLYIALCEHDAAIDYFKNNYLQDNKEVLLLYLLKRLYNHELIDCWVSEYKNAIKNRVKPRESIREVYEYIQRNGKFPD